MDIVRKIAHHFYITGFPFAEQYKALTEMGLVLQPPRCTENHYSFEIRTSRPQFGGDRESGS